MFSWIKNKKEKTNIEQTSPDRYLDLAKANHNKQRIVYSLLVVCTFLVMILGYVSFKSNTKVYIVEKEGNNYTYFGYVNDLTKNNYKPDDKSLIYFINQFITKSRFLPSDLVLYKKNQKELGHFLNRKSATKLDNLLTDSNYPKLIQNADVVEVQILSTIRLSPQTFQIRWIEKIYDKSGEMYKEFPMVGFIKYKIESPKNQETILNNPLGIIVEDLSMSEEKNK